ncbi:MAG: hypothetical protein LBD85_02535 [Oscillospiraceae bacterium]|jgi:hypothetical protein|nr:hypothetical protein [Oscillospiraceae bacterium]
MRNIIQKLNSRYARLPAVLTLALALLGVFLLSGGKAADEVYFTSINDKLLPLAESDMPINLGGAIYIPYDVFHSTDLGITAFYSSGTKVIRMSTGITDLYFDLKDNISYDNDGVEYPYSTMTFNSKPYLPARFVCRFFELEFAIINTDIAPIVRITSGLERYDSARFVKQAETRMRVMYEIYAQQHPIGSTAPAETSSAAENTVESLTFIGAVDIEMIIDAVTDGGSLIPTSFILTADEISENGDAVRRALGSGISIAIAADPTESDSERLARAYLREVAEITPSAVYTQMPETISVETAINIINRRTAESYSFIFDTASEEWSPELLNQLIGSGKY